jgi:hypothetical protein
MRVTSARTVSFGEGSDDTIADVLGWVNVLLPNSLTLLC